MDEGIRRLEREASGRPGDEQVARAYERALERGGRREALRRRYTLKFLCPLRFEELVPTRDPLVRACGRCCRSVHFVRTPEELADRVAKGSCVAFERRTLALAIDLVVADPRFHSAAERRRPCVVATDMRYVDLDAVEVDREVLDTVPYDVASTYWVFPLAIVGEELYLAMADPSAENLTEDLTRVLGVSIRPVLAAQDAIERALARRRHAERWRSSGRILGQMF